ncbi:MAG: DUF4129 domain-containing protein [Saprospiraceae bacterium]|nr:DUF4129 domain-containing protein [Saprospiraceae bacterium]
MKNIFFLCFLCLYTEGGLLAQKQPTVFEKDFAVDTTAINSLTEEGEETAIEDTRPRVSPYKEAQEKYSQENINQRDIDAEKWRKATAGIDYSEDKIEKRTARQHHNSATMALAGLFLALLKWFFIIGGIALVAFLLYRFITGGNVFGTKSRKIAINSEEIDLDKIEENLEKIELDPIIQKAIAAKNFPLTIRLYYLAILKELTLAGAIIWKKDKTNRIYAQEMQPHPLIEKFRQVTAIFERVWYGDTPLTETGFEQVRQPFISLLNNTRELSNPKGRV